MDRAVFCTKKTFKTICRLQLLCLLLGCALPCARGACTGSFEGSSTHGSPRLVTYRPKLVDRSTNEVGVFVLSRKFKTAAAFPTKNRWVQSAL